MNGWSIKKEVTVGDLIAITFAISSVILAYGALDARLAKIEEFKAAQVSRDIAQDASAHQTKQDIADRLDRIEDKLDRLIERRR